MKHATIAIASLMILVLCVCSHSRAATMAHGWCYQEEDSALAAGVAIARLKENLNGKKPSVIFLSSTSIKLDVPAIVAKIAEEFGDTPVWGATSALGLFMNNDLGYMRGSVVGLVALCSDEHEFFVRGAAVDDSAGGYVDAAARICREARRVHGEEPPSLILFTSDPGSHEELVIKELKRAFGRKIPIFGGSCGTEAPNPRYAVANGGAYSKGLSLCLVYATKRIGYCYQMGYRREKVSGTATDVDGRWVKTIDGRPALDVYNEWTDGFFSDVLKNNKPIRGEGQMYHPLAVVKQAGKGRELVISLSAKGHDPETGAIEFFACVDKGDTLTVLKGDTESLIARNYLGVAKAKRMAGGRIAGGLVFYCSGARMLLERQARTGEMAAPLKRAFGEKPFILMFHNGEHGQVAGSESFHGNLMLGAVVFPDDGRPSP